MSSVLLLLLVLLVIVVLPRWRYSRAWGYGPSSLAGVALVAVVVLLMTRTIHV